MAETETFNPKTKTVGPKMKLETLADCYEMRGDRDDQDQSNFETI